MLTSRDVAEILGVSVRRLNALALARGVGLMVGNHRIFSKADIVRLKPGPVGNPNFGSQFSRNGKKSLDGSFPLADKTRAYRPRDMTSPR